LPFWLYLGLALVTTHPLWRHLADAVPGDIGDPLLNTWILAWDTHALLADPLHLFDANVFYPLPNTLAYSEHLLSTALLAMPLSLVAGEPVAAYNLSLLLSFPLAGLGMYLLALRWTRRRGAALLAGLAFAFAPYRLAAAAHLQLLTMQWLPFSLLALDRLLGAAGRESRPGSSVRATIRPLGLFVLFAALQVLAGWYLAVFSGLVWGMYGLSWLAARRRPGPAFRASGRLLAAGLLVLAVALPFALPYWQVLPELQAARPASLAAAFGAHPADFLAAAPHLRLAGPASQALRDRPGFTEENTLFLGVVAPLLALAGLWPLPRRAPGAARGWRPAALWAILVISLALTFAGPYGALVERLPALAVVRVPPRWIIPATFALAALAGFGAAGLLDRGRRAWYASSHTLGVLLGLLLVAESLAAPLPLAAVGARGDLPPVYQVLSEQAPGEPGAWGVVELPMHAAPAPEYPEARRLYASTLGWWGLVNGYSGLTPGRQAGLARDLAGFPGEQSLAALRRLGEQGVRYLVVHPGEAPLDRAGWEAAGRWEAERGTSLLPLGSFGPDELYLVNPYGDGLLARPEEVADLYWSARRPTPAGVHFSPPGADADIHLLGHSLWGGDEVRLVLYWRASAALEEDYTVFVHSLDAEGQLIGQADGPPLAGRYPTSAWRPGEIVQDSRAVPPGARYLVGLYDAATGGRLPARTAGGGRLPGDAWSLPGGAQDYLMTSGR
jgi:hypothetical protein